MIPSICVKYKVEHWIKISSAFYFAERMVRLVRNTMNFVDLCRGEFGRKVAYTGVDRITPQNVVKVVSDTIGIHNRNRTLKSHLYILTYILFLSKTFGQALDLLVLVS